MDKGGRGVPWPYTGQHHKTKLKRNWHVLGGSTTMLFDWDDSRRCVTPSVSLTLDKRRTTTPDDANSWTVQHWASQRQWRQTATHFLFGVSAKHFNEDVSTTVSQKDTTGSATFMSTNTQLETNKLRITMKHDTSWHKNRLRTRNSTINHDNSK